MAEPIGNVVADPANARKHGEKNLAAIAASLRVYGQRTPIVVNKSNSVVLKGNGTLAAALTLGWTHLAVVWVEDDPATAAGYAIADNRTAELAEWDEVAVKQLLDSITDSGDEDLGAMFDELAQDLDIVPKADEGGSKAVAGEELERKYQVILEATDEQQQLALLEEFEGRGIEAKALTI